MLLQISEPESPKPTIAPHRKIAVGIDLGTTHTLVAVVVDGKPQCLADDTQGSVKIPSIVHFGQDGHIEVGEAAQAKLLHDPKNTIVSVKRFMGRTLDEIPMIHTYPYHFEDQGNLIGIRTIQGIKNPIEISAHILMEARRRVMAAYADQLNVNQEDPLPAVITVPAYFDDAQRQATKDAAKLANIQVLRLLNEPTAAAVAYGIDGQHNTPTSPEALYAVYDLGGGTFDISILAFSRGVFQVHATHGNTTLGGDDFDRTLYHWLHDALLLPKADEHHIRKLLVDIQKAREQLTDTQETTLTIHSDKQVHTKTINRDMLNTLTKPLVDQTITSMRRTLKDAKLRVNDFSGVILVGGATRMLHVRDAVEGFFQQSPLTGIDPDKIVAEGAARQADILVGNHSLESQEHLLLDVLPLSLGIETYGGLVERIIMRNAVIPVARAQTFTTQRDAQHAMSIHVVQGEREMVDHCRSLARFELRGLPPIAAGLPRIRVTFQVDADGLLTVTATEETTQTTAQVEVKPSYGLTESDIVSMLRESMQRAKEDVACRQLAEQRVIAEETMMALKKMLQEDSDLLDPQTCTQLHNEIAHLDDLIKGHDLERIRHAVDTLNQHSASFAQVRMDKHIRKALKGQRIDQA